MRPFSSIFITMTDVIPSIKRRSLAPIIKIRTVESVHSYIFLHIIYSTEFRFRTILSILRIIHLITLECATSIRECTYEVHVGTLIKAVRL